MLELKSITKDYPAGNGKVAALRGIDLQFRDSEFVAILGPSGCGKTTTLNIIGGLDQYTSGDLIINGRSTRDYRDRDWDAYRNHSVGFVFQNYHLIPHQSVLQNVELALSLSGVPLAERRRRAKEALERVGLGDQLKKRPGEMSGGQMQRVAIARAIVNDPDIVLADEPTGALDSETSVQVMDILKEISKDRLIIMVTHNPLLAERYATRTVRMLDGRIESDSMPLTEAEVAAAQAREREKAEKSRSVRLPGMSFSTSFGLSLKNLFTKKGRTILTAFAGSIGIIGIALIYAVSQGMTNYIDTVQEETLSSYPLTLEATHMDVGSLLQSFMGTAVSEHEHERDAVYQKSMIYDMMNALNSMEAQKNDLNSFKKYVEAQRADADSESAFAQAVTGVQYTYDMDIPIYTESVDGKIIRSDTQTLMQDILLENFGMDVTSILGIYEDNGMMGRMESMASFSPMSSSIVLWQEMLSGDNGALISPVVLKQYELVYGEWPTRYDEIVLVLDENNELDDLTLYALGLRKKEDINRIVDASMKGGKVDISYDSWSYAEICDMEFRTILPGDCYKLGDRPGVFIDLRDTEAGLTYLYDNGLRLKVSGIVRPQEDALAGMLSGSIGYTGELTKYIARQAEDCEALRAQKDDPTMDVFSGLPFRANSGSLSEQEKRTEFENYIGALDTAGKAEAYVKIACIPEQAGVDAAVAQTCAGMARADMQQQMAAALMQQMSIPEAELTDYLDAMKDEEIEEMFGKLVAEQYRMQYAAGVREQLAPMPPEQLVLALEAAMAGYSDADCALYYDEVLEFSEATYESNLRALGSVDLETPATINLYAASFDDKELIETAIADYNDTVAEFERINYTDYVGLLMSSVTTIINAITYVLIAFVAVSLVVSSIMIGVITLISVQERTKEIGILRAIGASKRNVSSMFNAETVIIGFASGVLGIGVTYLLCIPINAILHYLTGIGNLSAHLPLPVALSLVAISVLLTLISGIIPSRSAAKKDPVVALRTE